MNTRRDKIFAIINEGRNGYVGEFLRSTDEHVAAQLGVEKLEDSDREHVRAWFEQFDTVDLVARIRVIP